MSTAEQAGATTPGKELEERMTALGVTKMALSQASGKSRNTINNALADHDTVRPSTYSDLMRVLADIAADREGGPQRWVASDTPTDIVKIELKGVFGVESVTFSGPTEDVDAVKQAAVDFVRQLRENVAESGE